MLVCLFSCILYAAYVQMGADRCKFMLCCTSFIVYPNMNLQWSLQSPKNYYSLVTVLGYGQYLTASIFLD